jgi:hydrogenase-4 component F
LSDLNSLWNRGLAGRFLLGALAALGGLPPFVLFVSELLVVAAGIAAHQWLALGLGAIGLLLAFAALARAGVAIESGQVAPETSGSIAERPSVLSIGAAAAALACAALIAIVPWTGALR